MKLLAYSDNSDLVVIYQVGVVGVLRTFNNTLPLFPVPEIWFIQLCIT